MASDPIDDAAVLNALFGNSPQGLFVFDSQRKVMRYNPSGRGVWKLAPEDVIGHEIDEFAPGVDSAELRSLMDEALAGGVPLRGMLIRGKSPSDPDRTLAVEVSLFPLPHTGGGSPGLVGVIEDVTERQAGVDRLAVLSKVHKTVGSTLDVRTTADELVRALVPAFADGASVDLLDDGPAFGPLTSGVPLRRISFAPAGIVTVRKEGDSRPFPYPTPHTQALNDTEARIVPVTPDAPWLAADPEMFEPLLRANVHSMIVVPLTVRDTVLGLVSLYRNRTDPFEEADLDVARQAAATTAAHLENARSYRREHMVASTLQRKLQPSTTPRLSAVETAHMYLPESAGGDWYDVIPLSGTRVALVVGDVAGHGIEAAATMGQLRIALRTLALQDLETDELLTHLDEVAAQLGEPSEAHVATCAVAVYNPVSRRCAMVRAGHPAPVIVDPKGSPIPVHVPLGPPLGAGGGRVFTPALVDLPAGTLIALYTNGLLGARAQDPAAARHALARTLASPARPLRELSDDAVYRMAPSRDDDAVLLLARTHTLAEENVADWTLPAEPSVVSTARRLVDQQLAVWHLEGAAYTTGLIVSELVTNAIRYGTGPIKLRLIHDSGRLLTEVTDANSTSPHLRHARESDEGGRGLYIVMRLSTRWGVRHSHQDKTIWSEQGLGAEPDTQPAFEAFDVAEVDELS
ncbi:SpoIIE family protein phosphatase [Streptomyces seoulensis]|uniref:SpoIIE family protein phosphatase n=1 Tax=Streptomyces seoulensis TaxID=73044 RepID=UPI0033ADBB62